MMCEREKIIVVLPSIRKGTEYAFQYRVRELERIVSLPKYTFGIPPKLGTLKSSVLRLTWKTILASALGKRGRV
jgi:hypothetical protein